MTTVPKPLPKWKIDRMEAAIQDLQRLKVPITRGGFTNARELR
jgi:hypothetical protein